MMGVSWQLSSGGGAIGIFDLSGETEDMRGMLSTLGGNGRRIGDVWLANLFDVDRGVVAWVGGGHLQLMPHGGTAVLARMAERLEGFGIQVSKEKRQEMFPEARDQTEACMLAALSRAASPRALDLIATHAERWRDGVDELPQEDQRMLTRLTEPPLVIAVGAPNIGKSSLLNALAGRSVAIASDEVGTTRDRVGAMLTLDGLTVRWLDLPGLAASESEIDAAAIEAGLSAAALADLVIQCFDEHGKGITLPPEMQSLDTLEVALRIDRSTHHDNATRLVTSARRGEGLGELAVTVRERLLPEHTLAALGTWRFHPDLASRRSR